MSMQLYTLFRRRRRPDVAPLVLHPIRVEDLLRSFRPGSQDWPWYAEARDLWTRDAAKTNAIMKKVRRRGIGFLDHHSPILLGSDARVWDGHHRIVIATWLNIDTVMVETHDDQPPVIRP